MSNSRTFRKFLLNAFSKEHILLFISHTPVRLYLNNPTRQAKKRWKKCLNRNLSNYVLRNLKKSKSQLQQDLLVSFLSENYPEHFPKFFVEFGATNGLDLSNTYYLENSLGWTGILAEPAKIWHERLLMNRQCSIDLRAIVAKSGGKAFFSEYDEPELSRIDSADSSKNSLQIRKSYDIETVTLKELLLSWNAPFSIGYLSIDTEGTEMEILRDFDFQLFDFQIITVEHNYVVRNFEGLQNLLLSKDYVQIFPEVSEWEHWFVAKRLNDLMFSEPV